MNPSTDQSLLAGEERAPVVVLGASSVTGRFLLARLVSAAVPVLAISRHAPASSVPGVTWIEHDLETGPPPVQAAVIVSLGPLKFAAGLAEALTGVRRLVALSSASVLFKQHSPDSEERGMIAELADCEHRLHQLAEARSMALTLLRPTLIYGGDADGNVSRIAGLAGRLPWLPYAGRGLRQPVHADDLARIVITCLSHPEHSAGTWSLAGGEALSYPDMLRRIASRTGRAPRLLWMPAALLKLGVRLAHLAGRQRDIRPVMIDRQHQDLVVDDQPAREQLGWNPRPFRP